MVNVDTLNGRWWWWWWFDNGGGGGAGGIAYVLPVSAGAHAITVGPGGLRLVVIGDGSTALGPTAGGDTTFAF